MEIPVRKKVYLQDYGALHYAYIKDDPKLPWPEFVIYNNLLFRFDNKTMGNIGYYRRELGVRVAVSEER